MKLVFISYSRTDEDFANRLRDDLQTHGITVWIDTTGLKPGTRNWEHALRKVIRESQAMILVASPSSCQSNYVQGELEIAEMYKCPVFPLWAAGEEWADCIPLALIKMQYIDARGDAYAAAVPQLVEALGQVPVLVEKPVPVAEPDFEPRNPYKGLRAFRESDAGDFFGREKLIDELVEAMGERINNSRLLAVIGPSGSGKSSVVMAGLLPRLRKGALPNSADWVYLDPIIPGSRPLESLCTALASALPEKSNAAIRQDLDDPEGRGLHLLGCQVTREMDKRMILFIDQFEELFTQTIDADERRQFITLLVTAVTEAKGPVIAILTLRADFYDRPIEYSALADRLKSFQIVPPMSIEDLRDVIEKPAALDDVGLTFEERLVGDLLFEVREQVGGLPLLQFTLDQLFEQRQNHVLTLSAYQEMGGLRGALARHAEATYTGLLTDEHRRLARTLFLRLIEPGATEQDTTRRRADITELELPDANRTEVLREVTDVFVTARLLTTGKVAGKATIEVSHEALIREWARLGGWLSNARSDVIIQQDVSGDAATWVARGRNPNDDLLYRGTVLEERLAWAGRNILSKDEQAFIEASQRYEIQTAEREHQRQRSLRQARVGAVLVVIIALALIAAMFAIRSESQAREADKLGTQISQAQQTLTPIQVTLTSASGELATMELQGTASLLNLQRFSTLAAGGAIIPAAQTTHDAIDVFATATQIAVLNGWIPHRDQAYQEQYGVVMVQVPAGCFWMGSVIGYSDESPVHEVCFDEPFWIDQYEVTNEQFERLEGEAEAESSWLGPNQPRTDITWFEAYEFCQQRGAQLPTEAQWEYAARGPDSLIYPWGNKWAPENAVSGYDSNNEPADVSSRLSGASWVGAYDLSGNVWEWTNTIHDGEQYPYPYDPDDGREAYSEDTSIKRVMRGGSFDYNDYGLRAAYRLKNNPANGDYRLGFRCVHP
jgi:formylglycine-generating enzyme required for sulfatase activity